jgi:Tfp pilus assembly protein PilF
MALHRKLYGKDAKNAEIAFTLMNLGKLQTDQGNHDEAEKSLKHALKMQQKAAQVADYREEEGTSG